MQLHRHFKLKGRRRLPEIAAERRLEGREHLPQSGEPPSGGASAGVLSEHAAAQGGEHGEGAGQDHDHQGGRPQEEVRHRAGGHAEGKLGARLQMTSAQRGVRIETAL